MPSQKPLRGKSLVPSIGDQQRYSKELREAADRGDPFAKAALIIVGRLDAHLKNAARTHAHG